MFIIDIRSNIHLIATVAFAFIIAGLLNFAEEGLFIDYKQTSNAVNCDGASVLIRGVRYNLNSSLLEVFVDNTGDIGDFCDIDSFFVKSDSIQ